MTQNIQPDDGISTQIQRHKTALEWLGGVLLIFGLGTVLLYGQTNRLSCVRQTYGGVDCTSQVFWFDVLVLSRPEFIQDVIQAEPAISCNSAGTFNEYECEFTEVKLSGGGKYLLIGSEFLNTQTARETSDRINGYLQQTSNQPLVVSNMNFWTTVQGLICVTPPFIILGSMLIRGQRLLLFLLMKSKPTPNQH